MQVSNCELNAERVTNRAPSSYQWGYHPVHSPSDKWRIVINGALTPFLSIPLLYDSYARCVRFSLKRSEPDRNRSDGHYISARSMNVARLATRFRSSSPSSVNSHAAPCVYQRGGSRLKLQSEREHRPIVSENLQVRFLRLLPKIGNENLLYSPLAPAWSKVNRFLLSTRLCSSLPVVANAISEPQGNLNSTRMFNSGLLKWSSTVVQIRWWSSRRISVIVQRQISDILIVRSV